MTNNIDELKKKIIYKSSYRGSKEMDILLGSFTKKYIDILDPLELSELIDLVEVEDEDLFKLNNDKILTSKFKNNRITNLFKEYKYNNKP